MRASEADRERTVGILGRRFAEGYLSTDTFVWRVEAAYGAKTAEELGSLVGDLPHAVGSGGRLRSLVARLAGPLRGSLRPTGQAARRGAARA